jgi:hypothetical protein
MTEERALFRRENDISESDRPISDDLEDEWCDWWATVVEMWEDRVRHELENTDELTLTDQHPVVEAASVSVRIKERDD